MDNNEYLEYQKTLFKKANLYENMHDRDLEKNEKLASIIHLANELMAIQNPMIRVSIKNSTGINWKEITADLYEKMDSGISVGIDLVRNMFPDWNEKYIYYLLAKLKTMPYVTSRKEGIKVLFFIQKETKG